MKKIIAIIYVALLSTFVSCDDDLKFDENEMNDYVLNFESLWQEIDQKYCFFDYKKDSIKNWHDVHDEYLPYVRRCNDDLEFFDVLSDVLNELKDGHVNLISSFDISSYDFTDNYPDDIDYDVLANDRYLGKDSRYSGGIRYKTLRDGKVGYMRYADFMTEFTDSQLDFILNLFGNTAGVIIDVRSNGGGSFENAKRLISHFIDESYTVAYHSYKNGKGHSDFTSPVADKVEPVENGVIYKKPVYVLTNRGCYSATNEFTFSIKGLPRVKVIGGKTGGGAGAPLSTELPNGWMVRYSGALFLDKNLKITEFGVEPDVEIHLSETLAEQEGLDSIIETACDYIEGKIK